MSKNDRLKIKLAKTEVEDLAMVYGDLIKKYPNESVEDRLFRAHIRSLYVKLRQFVDRCAKKNTIPFEETEITAFVEMWQLDVIESSTYTAKTVNKIFAQLDKMRNALKVKPRMIA